MPVGYHRNAPAASPTDPLAHTGSRGLLGYQAVFRPAAEMSSSAPFVLRFTPAGNFASRRSAEQDPAKCRLRSRSHSSDRVEAEAATVAVQRQNEHQHEKEKICPRPLASRAVEAELQIDYLKGPDQSPQAYEDAKDQRN
jgi:hypothetical protein